MNYKVTITTLTPVHIGTGQELLNLYDLKQDTQQQQTYRLNVDAILDDALTHDNSKLDQRILNLKPAELVDVNELRQYPKFSIYLLKGTPRSGQVKEQIKNVWGQLYLPGSSLKGALRTAIARSIANQFKGQLQISDRARKKTADDLIEQKIFGHNPNYDLLRALQVADSQPVDIAPELINVSVVKKGKAQAPIDVEAIPRRTTFETTIHLEDYLYKEIGKVVQLDNRQWGHPVEKLGWIPDQTKLLYNLPIAARNLAQKRFKQELTYFQAVGLKKLVEIYNLWLNSLPALKGTQAFYLQLGWAGGWDNKTLGAEMIAQDRQGNFDPNKFAQIRNDFELGKPPKGGHNWRAQPNDTFPSSRRLRVNSKDEPIEPLGWVEVRLEKRD